MAFIGLFNLSSTWKIQFFSNKAFFFPSNFSIYNGFNFFYLKLIIQRLTNQMSDNSQKQYSQLLLLINKNSYLLSKHDNIRLKHWLQKLSTPVTNNIWRQNRNLYLKILFQMIGQGELMRPFNQSPPEGPLPKITIYDVPYPIRVKLTEIDACVKQNTPSQGKGYVNSRKNSLSGNVQSKRSISKGQKGMQHKKKIIFDLYKSEQKQNNKTLKLRGYYSNQEGLEEGNLRMSMDQLRINEKQEQRQPKNSTSKFGLAVLQVNDEDKKTERKGLDILKKSLGLLGRYHDTFSDSVRYKNLLQKIVETGDLMGENLREIKIISNQETEKIQQYNERIKNKFFETDLNTIEFMNYLNTLA